MKVIEKIKRWEMNEIGRSNLKLNTTSMTSATENQVLIKVKALSLNSRDKMMIETGMWRPLDHIPFTPGSDMAGVIVEAGNNVKRFKVGDRVISNYTIGWTDGYKMIGCNKISASDLLYASLGGTANGVFAEYVALPEDWLSPAPTHMNDIQASTLPVAALTAWFPLIERISHFVEALKAGSFKLANSMAGQSVLIQGTGGVALFALQIAKAAGAEVFLVSRSAEKLARAKALGVDHCINRTTTLNWVEEIYKITNHKGIDHILEMTGGDNLGRSIEAASVGERISLIGGMHSWDISGPSLPLLIKGLTIQGVSVGHRKSLENMVKAFDEIQLQPIIDKVYPFADLNTAMDHLDRGPFGKIVLTLE